MKQLKSFDFQQIFCQTWHQYWPNSGIVIA